MNPESNDDGVVQPGQSNPDCRIATTVFYPAADTTPESYEWLELSAAEFASIKKES